MAGHDNGNRIAVVGHPHRTACAWVTHHYRNVFVAAGFASRNGHQSPPHGGLKLCAAQVQWEVEFFAPAFKVFAKLPGRFFDHGRFRLFKAFGWCLGAEKHPAYAPIIGGYADSTDGKGVKRHVFHQASPLLCRTRRAAT